MPTRIALPEHHLSIAPSSEWTADASDPKTVASFGIYLRSKEHGVYLNVRGQEPGAHATTEGGLLASLRAQEWASASFDEWTIHAGSLIAVGGTFETTGMGGEIVLEVFVTDGRFVANLAAPGERSVIAAVIPSVQRLVSTIHFEGSGRTAPR